jgi:hypothetical protein
MLEDCRRKRRSAPGSRADNGCHQLRIVATSLRRWDPGERGLPRRLNEAIDYSTSAPIQRFSIFPKTYNFAGQKVLPGGLASALLVADVASGDRRVVVVTPVVGIAAGLGHVDQVLNGDPIGWKLVLVPRRIRHGHRLAAVKAKAFLVLVVEAVAVEEALKPDLDGFAGWGGHGDSSRKTGAMLMRPSRGSVRVGIGNGVGQSPDYHSPVAVRAQHVDMTSPHRVVRVPSRHCPWSH